MQAAHIQFTCAFVVVFDGAVDLRMKKALHTVKALKMFVYIGLQSPIY